MIRSPTDLASAHALIIAQRQALSEAQHEAQHRALLIEKLKYTIKKLRHERFGQSSERGALLDQLELQLAWHAPVDAFEQVAKLRRRNRHCAIRRRGTTHVAPPSSRLIAVF